VVTDRKDLDKQIYDNFVDCGAITEKQARAESGKDLQRRLQEDRRYIFTLIQKFGTKKGEQYPVVSRRSDIIVITDEAHRTQYDQLALNMRNGVPNAAFIAFTGTPLIAGEEKTWRVFGDYVSIYNFQQSVEDKATVPQLVAMLRRAVEEAVGFCRSLGFQRERLLESTGFTRVKLLDDAVEAILVNDATKRRYGALAERAARFFRAVKPDPAVNEFQPICTLLAVIAEKIRSLAGPVDISDVMAEVEGLLDRSIDAKGYAIQGQPPVDLSRIDFETLRKRFKEGRKRIEIERLRNSIAAKLHEMIQFNRSRMDYLEKFQQMIDEYNSGSENVEELFGELVKFAKTLTDEERRGVAEGLSEEELAIYDLLRKAGVTLSVTEEQQIKKVAKELLERLKSERPVLDWRKKQQARAAVRQLIEQMLDRLPPAFTPAVYEQVCERAYLHVHDCYYGEGKSVYSIPPPRSSSRVT